VVLVRIKTNKVEVPEFETLGFHSDSDCDRDDHGEFTKLSNLKNILLNNLYKSDFSAFTHFCRGEEEVLYEELNVELRPDIATVNDESNNGAVLYDQDEEPNAELRHDLETLDDESNNGAGVDDQDEADVMYKGIQEAYDSVFVEQGHRTCMDEDRLDDLF
jgi:hypothetical protein